MSVMPAELIEDSTDDFGWRRIVFDLGDGTYHTLSIAHSPDETKPTEFVALPVTRGTGAAPGFALWVPFEGEPQFNWLGYTSLEDVRDRWVQNLNQRPELADAIGRLLEVLAADDDDETTDK